MDNKKNRGGQQSGQLGQQTMGQSGNQTANQFSDNKRGQKQQNGSTGDYSQDITE